jgi:hypothetical protein
MTDDLKRIEKSGSESIAALRSILTALEITNTLRENESKILPLMGEPVVIITLESNHRGETYQSFRRVTALSTEVLEERINRLIGLNRSPDHREVKLEIKGMVDGVMRTTNDGTGTSVITIGLIKENSGRT